MIKKATLATLMVLLPFAVVAEMDREKDIQNFADMVTSGNWVKYKEAAQLLEWSGLSDSRIFDPLEEELLKITAKKNPGKQDIDLASWLLKALSFSGQNKYYDTVLMTSKKTKDSKIKKYAKLSLGQFEQYNKWNPIINSDEQYNKNVSPEINRFANMLRSDDFPLMELAAKRIHFEHQYDEYLMDVLAKAIETNNKSKYASNRDLDSMGWMMKALGGSRSEKHKPVLESLLKSGKHRKIRDYARKYLRYYS